MYEIYLILEWVYDLQPGHLHPVLKKKKERKKKNVLTNNYEHCLSYRNENGCTAVRGIGTVANEHEHTSYLYTENSGVLAFGSSVVTAIKQCRDNSGFTRVPSSILELTTSRPFLNPSWSHFFLLFFLPSSLFCLFSLTLSLSSSFITLLHIISKGLSGKGGRSIEVIPGETNELIELIGVYWRNRSLMFERYYF